ncbi:MAG: hypothetical protein NC231_12810 [Bacillus sp. (in: Bacteria)]|nr:hypothetical protein [Bacillus sp. (in: firmicutes)]MCM1426706.1 hypothetical protein [Eubacterium sp.]
MAYSNYEPIIGTIVNMARGNDCCSQMMTLRTNSGITNFMITPETHIIDNRPLRAGLRVAAFYDASLPMPLIFPPQYRAQIITVLGRNEQVMINEFDRNLLARDNSLQLNMAGNTRVETINGQNTSCNPGSQTLLVYYSATTRSIPPQTTPGRIIILC